MMGRRERGQDQFFYEFDLDKVVPADHLVRQIDDVLDLDWVHKQLAPHYSHTGRPSIDPVLMGQARMLVQLNCSAEGINVGFIDGRKSSPARSACR
jgi:transposase